MNLNIGPLSLGTYNHIYSDVAGSKRSVVGAPSATPILLFIKHSTYVDPTTKVAGKSTLVRIEDWRQLETGGVIAPIQASLVVRVPDGTLISNNNVRNVVTDIVRLVGAGIAAGDQLALDQAIFCNGEQ